MGSGADGKAVTFGPLLKMHRCAAGLNQEELAQRSGLSVRAISDMERGYTTRPFVRSVRMLADAMMLPGLAREQLLTAAQADAGSARVPRGRARPANLPGPTAEIARQLPAMTHHFTGRVREMTALPLP
jgi:transcriptional regulator with XRE-family HTH domain